MPFDEDLSVQYGVDESALGYGSEVSGDGRGGESDVKVVRVVVTLAEGDELLRRLINDPVLSDIPVVVLVRR